jgi:hypothetical protein
MTSIRSIILGAALTMSAFSTAFAATDTSQCSKDPGSNDAIACWLWSDATERTAPPAHERASPSSALLRGWNGETIIPADQKH